MSTRYADYLAEDFGSVILFTMKQMHRNFKTQQNYPESAGLRYWRESWSTLRKLPNELAYAPAFATVHRTPLASNGNNPHSACRLSLLKPAGADLT